MFSLKKITLFFSILWCNLLLAEVHVIMTSAILDIDYDRRKEEYIKSIRTIQSYGIEPWIIEATPTTFSFFDEISNQALYPCTNDPYIRNKGVNEVMSIKASIPNLPFDDEDIVIKLTGRYWLYDRELIDIIQSTADDYDTYACFGKHFVSHDHIFTGAYAFRWKYFKQLVQEMDLEKAEKEPIPIEQIFADFVKSQQLRVKVLDSLHVEARIFGHGPGTDPEYIRRW